jgi:DNA-binding NtrC family response regulator
LAAAVLGGTLWSLQPGQRKGTDPAELYNVDRVPRSEGLDQLPADYSKLPPPALPPEPPILGEPLPGDLGGPMLKAERQAIVEALAIFRWNRRKVAEYLGVSYKTLLTKMKECGISEASPAS